MTGKANLKIKSKITLNFCFSYENISVAVVVAFFTCWSPFHSQRLMFVSVTLYGEWTDRLRASQHVLFMCSGIKADHWIPWCAFAPKPWFYTQNPYTKPQILYFKPMFLHRKSQFFHSNPLFLYFKPLLVFSDTLF